MTDQQRGPGRVLVTGGASGLGAAVVAAVARRGGTPAVIDQQPVEGVPSLVADVSDSAAVQRAVAGLADRLGGLDGLVTCAGIDAPGMLLQTDARAWERVIAVNLLGTAATVRSALPYLLQTRGRVVTVASTLGHRVVSDATAYCASKWGVVGFTRALMVELKGAVGVTLCSPGGMATAFFDGRDPQYQPGPDARLNRPEHVAEAIAFALCQPSGCEIKELLVAPVEEPSYP